VEHFHQKLIKLLEWLLVHKVFFIFILILLFDFIFFYNKDEIQKISEKLQEAQKLNIHIASEEFLNEIKKSPSINNYGKM